MLRSPARTRHSKPTPTNSLILVLPPLLFSPSLLPLFHAHFGTYGTMLSWTALERLGRVLVVYEEAEEAANAKQEMDGFVWEDEDERGESSTAGLDRNGANSARDMPQPLRAFFGPSLPVPLPTSLSSTLLSVPPLSKNFLISPPGSPPVGWEQIEEEAPNTQVWHEGDEPGEGPTEGTMMSEKWADELVRALRFLSVESNADEDAEDEELEHDDDAEGQSVEGTTQLILPSSLDTPRPAVIVSTPPVSTPQTPSQTATPPPGAASITAVKATIESMLGRKKRFGDLDGAATPGSLGSGPGGMARGGARITPTSRPPLGGDFF
ncbi:hypothetical protein JCM1841_000431 [Sporobolomyces salmonicolor]